MKTFQRVPPQSTRVQRTVCIWCCLQRGTNRGKEVRASGLLPRQSPLPKTLHTSGDIQHYHPTQCPQASARSSKPQALPAPFSSRQSHSPVVPPAQHQPTNSCTVRNTTTWSTLQYSQVTIYTTPQHQESISPRYQVLLHTCCRVPWDQQHQRIHLVTQNKQIVAGLFQVSFGSVLKQHDFSSPGFRKGVWLRA